MSIEDQINELLVQWDPIEINSVGGPVYDEYRSYIPRIMQVLKDKEKIKILLEHIVIEEMGLSYDSNNQKHLTEISHFADRLYRIV